MTNIRKIAKIAGVSASTVSRVLTGNAKVREETRQRILQALSDTNYQLPETKTKQNLCVGIVMPKMSGMDMTGHPAFSSATTMFIDEMTKAKIKNEIIIFDDEQLNDLPKLLSPGKDGYFILGTSEVQENALLTYFRSKKIPYIILNRWLDNRYSNYVNVDDTLAAYNATKYLIQQGHREIAFIGGNENFRNSKLRIKGYTMALEEAHIKVNPAQIHQGFYTEHYGYQFAEEFIKIKEKPTAALFSSDMIAVGFLNHIKTLGLSIPRDLSMIGWGDFNLSSYVEPPLTTVHVPNAELGAQAAKMLINLMETKDLVQVHVLMDATLTIRKSVLPLSTASSLTDCHS
mgnify:CR=1 FL=1|jgi:DNA-binding LacI/PurR family transcriptional regulator